MLTMPIQLQNLTMLHTAHLQSFPNPSAGAQQVPNSLGQQQGVHVGDWSQEISWIKRV